MKYVFLSFVFMMSVFFNSITTQAQETFIFSYAPAGFFNKVRVKGEIPFHNEFSAGAIVSFHYFQFRGISIEPFVRYYLTQESPVGAYLQAKLSAGYFYSNMTYTNGFGENEPNYKAFDKSASFPAIGAGFAFGYQFETRRSKYYDFFVGCKFMPFTGPETASLNGAVYHTNNDFDWLSLGPGSMLNCHFGIGYLF